MSNPSLIGACRDSARTLSTGRILMRLIALGVCLILISGLSACASREEVADDYRDLYSGKGPSKSNRTVIFFLVDGMPVYTVQGEMRAGKLPHIKDFFVGDKGQFSVARTAFPSLTYPSITSLLTESHVDQHGILGNLNEQDGQVISFESISSYRQLNATIKGKNIFSRLKAKGMRTASLDYAFHADADVHIDTKDLESGLSILGHDYKYIDIKTIDALKAILEDNRTAHWPDFIFVHLIGLDLTSHDHGPESREALDYIETLDASLSHIFKIIERVEKKKRRQVVVMMSADHGFDKKVSRYVDLERALREADHEIKFLNEGRYGSAYLPSKWGRERRDSLVQSLEGMPEMDIVAQRSGDQIQISGKDLNVSIYYKSAPKGLCPESSFLIGVESLPRLAPQKAIVPASVSALGGRVTGTESSGHGAGNGPNFSCPENLDVVTNGLFYPYFVANLSHYFFGHNHPDIVIIPKPGVAFTREYRGQHGGPTPGEVFVPLLMHNGVANPSAGIPSLSELLNFL